MATTRVTSKQEKLFVKIELEMVLTPLEEILGLVEVDGEFVVFSSIMVFTYQSLRSTRWAY
jgi:hypothetical protein